MPVVDGQPVNSKIKEQNAKLQFKVQNWHRTQSVSICVGVDQDQGTQKPESKVQNFNSKFRPDIKKRAFRYAVDTIKFLDHLNQKDLSVQVMARQLLRSATSIGANIVEAQAASSKREFTNFLNHSLKSANETKFWLALFRDSGKADTKQVDSLLTEAKELANILGSSILTLKGKRKP